jgi:hypothetical protein
MSQTAGKHSNPEFLENKCLILAGVEINKAFLLFAFSTPPQDRLPKSEHQLFLYSGVA